MLANNLQLISALLERGVPMTKDGKDLHRVQAVGQPADEWLRTQGEAKPLGLVVTKINGMTKVDALVYQ